MNEKKPRKPQRTPSRRPVSKPAEIVKAEAAFFKCPNGHSLPHNTNRGQCTPLHCCGTQGPGVVTVNSSSTASGLGKREKTPEEVGSDEKVRIARARSRFLARSEFLDVPDNLVGAEAEEWTDRKITSLLPHAAARLELNLKYGDDDQSERAAKALMDSTGRGKREMGGAGNSPIIVMVGGASPNNVPWVQKVEVHKDAPKTIGSLEVPKKPPVPD